jgi:hypothetical protein
LRPRRKQRSDDKQCTRDRTHAKKLVHSNSTSKLRSTAANLTR